MLVARDTVVTIHYTLKNDAGEVLDSSDGDERFANKRNGRCRLCSDTDGDIQ